jgi:energy-coupling factor transporter ATP-binding protein EcfA2
MIPKGYDRFSSGRENAMRKLTVKNFSVIKEAELEFGKITVLIGPQASGKSLLCTLAYFLSREIIMIAEGRIKTGGPGSEFFAFEKSVKKEFEAWFPRSSWGNQHWAIAFRSVGYEVTASGGGNPTEEISFSFCKEFHTVYAKSQTYTFPDSEYWPAYLLRGLAGQGVWDKTTYIPSERAYFVDTSKGYKLLASDPEPLRNPAPRPCFIGQFAEQIHMGRFDGSLGLGTYGDGVGGRDWKDNGRELQRDLSFVVNNEPVFKTLGGSQYATYSFIFWDARNLLPLFNASLEIG